ncbi:SRPBCC family protein [Mucilaginibacter myungsuensis]|uniref:SRPBCC domain-containing protein n=1 Tax=Mucilaginibacter myungsuensis TaxID=649104 RepID=A0A929PXS6_9SPHI|nr:SRPBCC family protein [Mucilaginibacter myungsuensis]MBE9664173.1 SRPBCC domain-containing protein [Mucilaginibacter myungsuensis]MDN3599876.1 SRPBCC family protein [Mucilaginibacter myungsuensis]
MATKLKSTNSISINAPIELAWQALTDPALIKQYLFGTTVTSDWKLGSAITYTGEWEGKSYEDKGQIMDVIPFKHLHTTYWSGMSGKADEPQNYVNVYYDIERDGDGTLVTVTQDGIENEEGVEHMNKNWGTVLQEMKKVLEGLK